MLYMFPLWLLDSICFLKSLMTEFSYDRISRCIEERIWKNLSGQLKKKWNFWDVWSKKDLCGISMGLGF